MKHTKGKCITTFNASRERGVRTDGGYICLIPKPTHYIGQDDRYKREMEEKKADAKLICEAFNVTNETGFTPRQLAEQKAELLKALIEIKDIANKHCNNFDAYNDVVYLTAEEAIKKATP